MTILKKNNQITYLIMALICLSGCACGPLGPWNNPKFDKFDWSSMEINYWIIVGEDTLEQRNFLLNEPRYIREGFSKMAIKDISGMTVPTSPQMHWNTIGGEKWYVGVTFEDAFSFTKKGNNLYYSYWVDLEDTAFFDWLRQRCLEEAQKDYPRITLASIKLRSNLSLNSSKYKPFKLPQPISEATQARIVNYNNQESVNRANALRSFEHYDAEGRLKPEKIFNKEFEEALEQVRENLRQSEKVRERLRLFEKSDWTEKRGGLKKGTKKGDIPFLL